MKMFKKIMGKHLEKLHNPRKLNESFTEKFAQQIFVPEKQVGETCSHERKYRTEKDSGVYFSQL